MTFENARERVDFLRAEIERHSHLYYDQDSPEISDYEYDMMFEELKEIENEFPTLDIPSSPTHKVGGSASDTFRKVKHEVRLGSLTDVFDFDALRQFILKTQEALGDKNAEFSVEPKIDGLSIALTYDNGRLKLGATRGNGDVGEDVTAAVRLIKHVPKKLNEATEKLTVRGEVYLPRAAFAALNAEREAIGEKLWANPRNAAAGNLRRLDPREGAANKLDIFVFNYQSGTLYPDGRDPQTHSETIERIAELGFTAIPILAVSSDADEIIDKIKKLGDGRAALPYDIDGAVVKLNSLDGRQTLGEVGNVPRWAVAYKYPPEVKLTRLLDITMQLGRTGILTPNAVLEPVTLAGTTVSRATLHNIGRIKERDFRIGDHVYVRKAGDIIPEITHVAKELRCGSEIAFAPPKNCPVCGAELTYELEGEIVSADEGDVARCTNPRCAARILRQLEHFASKPAMNIDGLGPAVIELLVENGLVATPSDIYSLDADRLAELPRMGKKSAEKLLSAIERSKAVGGARVLMSLGIRHLGAVGAASVIERYKSVTALFDADIESLTGIDDIGEITARAIVDYFSDSDNRELVKELEENGVSMTLREEARGGSDIFTGKTFVLTGTLPSMKREEASELIKNAGGRVSSSVSAKTDYVLAGDAAGSKLDRAAALGVKVIDEAEFKSLLGI